ncbi:diguanylate cyclase (GGDEF) domain-containing protein [Colwellia chukchiensis]|uniref:diguanylate cyclase n=1 Tax=Colwellia chukchiensis TaxID=641665 RepID=A0A1H7R3Y6_9GAMM|nr:GGDEF domain-containing protein [Colwellia chukchiensis]SEL54698.1 diguanylate cyclase (GGDEF) domain-containing protein [Colwellia chukchiensis]
MNMISSSKIVKCLILIPLLFVMFAFKESYAQEPLSSYHELKTIPHLNSDENRRFVAQILSEIEQAKYLKLQAPIYAYIAELKTNKGNWIDGRNYLVLAIATLKHVSNDHLLIDALASISAIFIMRGNYSDAIFYVQKLAEHSFETGNSRGQIIALNRLAKSYIELELYQLALEPLQKAIQLAQQTKNYDSELLATRYLIKLRNNLPEADPQETFTLMNKAERIPVQGKLDDGYWYRLKGVVNQGLGNFSAAKRWYALAYTKASSSHDVHLLQMVNKSFAELYLALNQPILALDYASESLRYNRQTAHLNNRAAIHYLLSNIYQQMGDDKSSLKYLRTYADFQRLAREKNTVSLLTTMDKRLSSIKSQHKQEALKNSLLTNKIEAQESEKKQQFFIFIIVALTLVFCFFLLVFIARQRILKAQMLLSMKDELTGIYCRSYLKEFLPAMQSRLDREPDKTLSLGALILDCDDFKFINDTFGHDGGDKALKAIVNTIKTQIREHDLLLRWGGDEFVLLCEAITQVQMRELTERIVAAVSDMVIEYDEHSLTVTVSAGYAIHDRNQSFNFDALIKEADEFLLASKKAGKNSYLGEEFVDESMQYLPNSYVISEV